MPMEGDILQRARLELFLLPSIKGTACCHVPLLGHAQGAHAPTLRLLMLKSFSGLKLFKKIFPLLHKLKQVNEYASQLLFSSFPPYHRDSWAGTGQCHSTEVNGTMPIYISWWFKPLDLLSGTHFFSTKPGYKAESRTCGGENTHRWFKLTLPPWQLHHNSRSFAETTSV